MSSQCPDLATLFELLEAADGDPSAAVAFARHVGGCHHCDASLLRLGSLSRALVAPAHPGPGFVDQIVRAATADPPSARTEAMPTASTTGSVALPVAARVGGTARMAARIGLAAVTALTAALAALLVGGGTIEPGTPLLVVSALIGAAASLIAGREPGRVPGPA